MIKDLQLEVYGSLIKTSWSAPRFRPQEYSQRVECSLMCDKRNELYKIQTQTEAKAELSFFTKDVRASSRCRVIFKAIYNPGSRDTGIIQTVITPAASEFKCVIVKTTLTFTIIK